MKKKKSNRFIPRRSFLLLELLISLGLILLCLIPLIRVHSGMIQEEVFNIEKKCCEREAVLAFAHIKEELFNQAFSWEKLEGDVEGFLEDIEVKKGSFTRFYQRRFKIVHEKTKDKPSLKKSARQLRVEIDLISSRKSFHFSYPLIIEGHER